MRRYLVVAHKTLGGPELMDRLHALREADAYCRFHLIVPVHHPGDHAWTEGEVEATASQVLEEVLDRMAAMGMGASGEVGDANPVYAVGVALRRDGAQAYDGMVLSTLPHGLSRWWRFDVPRRMARTYLALPLLHVVSEEALVA